MHDRHCATAALEREDVYLEPDNRRHLSGAPVARLRSTGRNDSVEVLYWSVSKERWAAAGPFGGTVLPLDEALQFIASEDIFWALC